MKLSRRPVRKDLYALRLFTFLSHFPVFNSISWLSAFTLSLNQPDFATISLSPSDHCCQTLKLFLSLLLFAVFSLWRKLMRPSSTPFTSCSHHIQLPRFLPLSSSEAPLCITSIQIFSIRGAAPSGDILAQLHQTLLCTMSVKYLIFWSLSLLTELPVWSEWVSGSSCQRSPPVDFKSKNVKLNI